MLHPIMQGYHCSWKWKCKITICHVHFINILTLNLVLMMYIDPAVSLTRTDGQFIWFKFFFWRIAAKKVTEGKICLPFVPVSGVSGACSQTNFFRFLLYLETLKTHTRNLWSPPLLIASQLERSGQEERFKQSLIPSASLRIPRLCQIK